MNIEALYHRHKQNWAFLYNQDTIFLRLRTMKNDVEKVQVSYGDKYDWYRTETKIDMYKHLADERFDYWEVKLKPLFGRLSYRFIVQSGSEIIYYAERWCQENAAPYDFGNFEYPYVNDADWICPPSWVKDTIFYQIFPDRFANGNPLISPENTQEWGTVSTKTNFFGGDLQGVMNHLDYLVELGINAIYFTPIFQADSNHKYDTSDYYAVDKCFGTIDILKELVEACHQRGIRVLLDIVFNHSGGNFPPFIDFIEKGSASRYADWFLVKDWSVAHGDSGKRYETFGFEHMLPKFNTTNPELCEYLVNISLYWLNSCNIDGYRLDVANEVDHRFWRQFRDSVKAVKQDIYIVGEIMHDAMAWLQGDQLDAVMDYPIRYGVMQFFAHRSIDSKAFADIVSAQLVSYPLQVIEASFQLLGSHDTARFLTLCEGNVDRLKLAVLFQFTYYGAPSIYYGDEIGMEGCDDPDNRRCMIWDQDHQNEELFSYYKKLISIRRAYPALRYGGYKFLHALTGDRSLAFMRWDEEERFIVAMNTSEEAYLLNLEVDGDWQDMWTDEELHSEFQSLSLRLEGHGFRLLRNIK